ncbi:unnamed protein product [Rhizoctonia solani]|uniref:PNPLA domain-containing protein n=1 Tax=Rhizoctonia solani TaxID=456999 RepID=A0A8H3A7A9_9AGAM|nr:unnamed protein product [Rhizoctonia solani]
MSIEDAIGSYTGLAENVFSDKKRGGISGGAAYKGTTLIDSLRSIFQDATGSGDQKMAEGAPKPDGCNTLIFATLKDNMNAGIPVIFRSYQVRANRAPDCAIHEAVYATMAHPDFFKSIQIADGSLKYSFVGGELGNSNPLVHVLAEVRDLYPGEYVSCIMSIGAGHAHTIQIPNGDRQQASLAMRAMATDSERVAEEMARRFQDTTGVYFRFNVDQGMQDIETDGWEKLSVVATHTQAYLNKIEVNRAMWEAAKAIQDRKNALAVAWIDGRVQRTLEPAIVKKCPIPTAYYTGRAKEIQGVGSYIVSSGYQQQVCVIYGLGGAGKSQLAFKAIEQNHHHWNHIIYVDASCKKTIERMLEDFARVNLKYLGDTDTITYIDTLQWLQETQDSWLLFFDGADDLQLDISPYFPISYRGNILVTTRLESRAGLAQPPEALYPISGMDPEDASSLLLRVVNRRAPSKPKTAADKMSADALVRDFGFLALAIVHAGAYIAHSTGLSIAKYHDQFRDRKREMLEKHSKLPQASRISNYKDTVYTTWNMCYELLGQHGKQGTQELLWLIAFLQRDGITNAIFERAAINIHLYAPILPAGELEKYAYNYLVGLGPHVQKLLSESHKLPDEEANRWEVNCNHAVCFANVFKSMKLWPEEEDLRTKVAVARANLLGLEDPATLQNADDLAQNYWNQGLVNRAETLYSEVLEVRRGLHREDHNDILTSKRHLASIYQYQGRLSDAVPFWEDVVEGYRVSKGGNHPETLTCMESLADVYLRSAQLDKEEKLRRDMINLMLDDDPDKPTCMRRLAEVLELKEEWDAAELQLVQYQEALKKVWGESHANATIDQDCIYELRVRKESVPPISCASCMHPADVASICPKSKSICDFAARAFGILPFSLAVLVVAYLLPICFGISS